MTGLNKAIGKINFLIGASVFTVVLSVLFLVALNFGWFSFQYENPAKWRPRSVLTDLEGQENASLIKLGYEVITRTPQLIGPLAKDAQKQFAGNNLTCQSCHLEGGTKPGAGSFVGVFNRFPQYRGREDKIGTLAERIDGCMERSMNGKKLPHNTLEMQAMIAYMKWLSDDVPEDKELIYKGFAKLQLPEVKADINAGKLVFEQHCVSCHGVNGQGVRSSEVSLYEFPPLWGPDSYNQGAGMHRIITAAEFIKSNMPFLQATLENPVLTDLEAYNVAAYINSFDRPQKSNPELDFPDKKKKPMSTPYGPWSDPFSAEQHKYGPYQPIIKYYKETFDLEKNK